MLVIVTSEWCERVHYWATIPFLWLLGQPRCILSDVAGVYATVVSTGTVYNDAYCQMLRVCSLWLLTVLIAPVENGMY